MSEMRALLCKVEQIREQLYLIIKGRGLTDPEVLAVSQQLDQALNEYRCVTGQSRAISDERLPGRGET
jgi:hypothetical protein